MRYLGAHWLAFSAVIGCIVGPVWSSDLPASDTDNPVSIYADDVPPPHGIWVDTLDLETVSSESGQVRPGLSGGHDPITLAKVVYPHGIGVRGASKMVIDLKRCAVLFQAMVGMDDDSGKNGSVEFTIDVDGKTAFDSGKMVAGQAPKLASANLTGAKRMTLTTVRVDATDSSANNADWAGAFIIRTPNATAKPQTPLIPEMGEEPVWRPDTAEPEIEGASVIGSTPGHPFNYLIPATGHAPLKFAQTGLPSGLTLTPSTGVITGTLRSAATSHVAITVSNSSGHMTRILTLVGGENDLAETPPMGWTATNLYGDAVTDLDIRKAADLLVSSGLAAHGYTYVNLGDSWQGTRSVDGVLQPNRRFPDMKALGNYIHSKGLKFGIYSSSSVKTCAGYAGSLGHEPADAQMFANWGVDYLTYDWCPDAAGTVGSSASIVAATTAMAVALQKSGRDIIFAATFTLPKGGGNRTAILGEDPASWAAKAGANIMEADAGVYDDSGQIMKYAADREPFAEYFRPRYWPGLGPLMVGRFGAPDEHFTRLRPGEQMMQMSVWSIFSAPLFVESDLSALEPNSLSHETEAVLTNDEVIAVDQDPLGAPPSLLNSGFRQSTWTKRLADGRIVVAFVNTGDQTRMGFINWADIQVTGKQLVRDIWKHADLGRFADGFSTAVPARGVVLIVIGDPPLHATGAAAL